MAHYLVSKDVIKSLAFPAPPISISGIHRRQRRPDMKPWAQVEYPKTARIHIKITGQVEEPL